MLYDYPPSAIPYVNRPMSVCKLYRLNKAVAQMKGGPMAPGIYGTVYFTNVSNGTLVCAQIFGLPEYQPAQNGKAPIGPHGFHIHKDGDCEIGKPEDPFSGTHGHWNPTEQPHGNHVGDFPVLFSNHGYAYMCFFTDKFRVEEVIGKAVVIHESPDDYRTQPAGNSGKKLACGVIRSIT